MKNKKHPNSCLTEISRRKYLITGAGLMAACYLASNATYLSTIESDENFTTSDVDYVLVDGWLLRADDLIS